MRRTWFISEDQHLLIQIQEDRLHLNWRRLKDGAEYFRHESLLSVFLEIFKVLDTFASEKGERLNCTGGEVMYMNQINRGALWQTWGDFSNLFADWAPIPKFAQNDSTVIQIGMNVPTVFPTDSPLGDSHTISVELKTGQEDNRDKILVLSLQDRGELGPSGKDNMVRWIQDSHAGLVKTFENLISDRAKEIFGKNAA